MADETASDERVNGVRVAVANLDETGAAARNRAEKVRVRAVLEARARARANTATPVVVPVPALMERLAKTSRAHAGTRRARVRLAAQFREIERAAAHDPIAVCEASVALDPAAIVRRDRSLHQ